MPIIRDNRSSIKHTKSIDNKIDILDRRVDELYKDIYTTRTDNISNIDKIIDDIDSSIDKIQGLESTSSSMSELLRRIESKGYTNTDKMMKSVSDLFSNDNLLGSIVMSEEVHRYISAQNHNYDLICKFLPRLNDALEIKRDNVLSSDNFGESFISPKQPNLSKEAMMLFNANTKKLEREYNISEFFDDTYMRVSKYGEDFIYIVPYPVAFRRLFDKQTNQGFNNGVSQAAQTTLFEGYTKIKVLDENYNASKDFQSYLETVQYSVEGRISDVAKDLKDLGEINLYVNPAPVVSSSIHEYTVLHNMESEMIQESMYHAFQESASGMTSMFSDVIANKGKTKRILSSIQRDGLILDKNLDRNPDKIDKDMVGAVLERLPRENVLPLYMGRKMLGCLYFEFAEDKSACGFCGGHHTTPGFPNAGKTSYEGSIDSQELVARYISSKLSTAIDSKFINGNKDLKEEIYNILRYNERFNINRSNNVGVTFIPAEDIVHCYFKMNENTHRGISDLENALIPAMLYILLYLTDTIGKITRSVDKRVYYVKQNVEQNIARTMMNVVGQIKKGNMGMRQIESMNNILNIVGKYNDYLIPVGPSGDPPIQFDIMQGQEINTPTDLMDKFEEAAVNTIMPYEMVNGTYQQDFAIKYSMSNTRLLKSLFTRRRKVQKFYSTIYTRVYNYEFGESFVEIEIMLPPPLFLVMQNNAQLMDNVLALIDKLNEVEISGNDEDDDALRMEVKRLYVRHNLGSYIDYDDYDRMLESAKVSLEAKKVPAVSSAEDEASPEDMMDDSL